MMNGARQTQTRSICIAALFWQIVYSDFLVTDRL
jgi:hypothetical protein